MRKRGIILLLIIAIMCTFNYVKAGLYDYPTISIVVKNIDVSNCEIMVMKSDGSGEIYKSFFGHKTTDGLLYGDYRMPSEYIIGIKYNGECKTTEVIETNEYRQKIVINGENMDILYNNNVGINFDFVILIGIIAGISTLFPLIIELILSLIFGVRKHWKAITITNIATQLAFVFFTIINEIPYMMVYLALEIIILGVELFVYREVMKEIPKGRVYMYTIIANLLTGYFVNLIVFQHL